MGEQRRRRPLAAAGWLTVTVLAAALALLVTAWFVLAAPFTVTFAYGAWLGLTHAEVLEAVGEASGDDAGRGPAGLSP